MFILPAEPLFFLLHVVVHAHRDETQYVRACEGAAASTPDCLQLKKAIDQGVGAIDLYRHLPAMVNVQGPCHSRALSIQ